MSSSAVTFPSYLDPTKAADGSAASPSFSFANSTSTGVYRVSANTLGISTAGVQRVVVSSTGIVGINAPTPAVVAGHGLHIQSNTQATLQLDSTPKTGGTNWAICSGSSGVAGTGFLAINDGTVDRLKLDSTYGIVFRTNILKTAADPGAVVFGTKTGGANDYELVIQRGIAGAGAYHNINSVEQGVSSRTLALNGNGGNVGINTLTANYPLTVNGQPAANGYTTFTNYSDFRLKENIQDLPPILSKINKLRPVTFNYNELTKFTEVARSRNICGIIAQELENVFPEMVGTTKIDDTEYLDTNLSNLTMYLVKAIQELSAKVDAQAAEIAELKAK